MRKLSLDPEALRVESFETVEAGGARGTVHANAYTIPPYPSCARTCGASPPPPSEDFCRQATLQECCY